MKKIFLLLIAGLASMANAQEKDPYLSKTLTGQKIENVKVETSGGSITVTGGSMQDSKVEVFVRANNNSDLSKEEIKKRLQEDYDLNVSVNGNQLVATAKPNNRNNFNWKRSLNISFKIQVPQHVSTNLNTSGGSIKLDNLSGNQNFSTSGGSLDLARLSGEVEGQTSGGSIKISNSKNEIRLSTSGGSINANNCEGNLKLETSGGSLHLSNLKGRIYAATSGGSIRGADISGELKTHTSGGNIVLNKMACSLETSTSGGNIDVELSEMGKYVKIENSGGNVDLTLPKTGLTLNIRGRIKTEALSNFSGSMKENELKGKLNGGGVPVDVDSGGGRVALNLQ